MNRIFVTHDNETLRAASIEDAAMFVERGWRELSSEEIQAAGMSGFEQYVSPVTATVLEDGRITFTPPTDDEISKHLFAALRSERDTRINSVLWVRERHADELELGTETSLTPEQYAALLTYIQALRGIPAQPGAPWDGGGELTPWPVSPLEDKNEA